MTRTAPRAGPRREPRTLEPENHGGGGKHSASGHRPRGGTAMSARSSTARGGPGVVLFRPFGIPVHVTASWLIVAALITLVYGQLVEGRLFLGAGSYVLAFVFAVLLYVSVLVHELAHSV